MLYKYKATKLNQETEPSQKIQSLDYVHVNKSKFKFFCFLLLLFFFCLSFSKFPSDIFSA